MEKCECYIHSLKQGETHVLGEATILKRLGDNDYLAEYNGVKCHAPICRKGGSCEEIQHYLRRSALALRGLF